MIISPSLLAADKNNLVGEANKMKEAGASFIHIDIMDGHFVPATTWDEGVVKTLRPRCQMVLDTHLMIENPLASVAKYCKAGSDIVTFHLEACKDEEEAKKVIDLIHSLHVKAGVSIKPNTPVEELGPYLASLDLVLVMSVEPGKGGQKFMPSSLDKIAYLSSKKKEKGYPYLLEVDGGINAETGRLVAKAGAEVLVAGSYLYGKEDYKDRLEALAKL